MTRMPRYAGFGGGKARIQPVLGSEILERFMQQQGIEGAWFQKFKRYKTGTFIKVRMDDS